MLSGFGGGLRRVVTFDTRNLLSTISTVIFCEVIEVVKLVRSEFGFGTQRDHLRWFLDVLNCLDSSRGTRDQQDRKNKA